MGATRTWGYQRGGMPHFGIALGMPNPQSSNSISFTGMQQQGKISSCCKQARGA